MRENEWERRGSLRDTRRSSNLKVMEVVSARLQGSIRKEPDHVKGTDPGETVIS